MTKNKFSDTTFTAQCIPMTKLQSIIGGKWKILILWYIAFYNVQRFGELMRRIDGITQSTLTKQLREIPPKVEYSLTEFGKNFIPILYAMKTWSEKYLCSDTNILI